MGTITLPNVRETSDITVKVRLKYSGVPIDWTGIRDIRALIYSDEQKAIAGRCSTSIDEEDNTILVCDYAATKPQYRGVNRIIVQGKYYDRTNTYDKPAFNIVAQNSDLTEQEAVIVDTSAEESVEVDVSIEITQVSTSLLDNAIAAAINAADHAEHAASLVPLEVLQECEGATEAANKAADLANEKAHLANEKAHLADSAASFANEKATLAAEKAEVADAKATLANEAAQRAEASAEHQVPYIGDNGNWFRWDNEAGEYVDTGEKAQGPQGIQGEPAVATENYVIAEATPETTDVADLLPEVGSADTLYRVACWDGAHYDTTVYSVYGWYDGAYKFLEKKEVGIDDEPTTGSQNFVKSGGVAAKISQLGQEIYTKARTTGAEIVKDITDDFNFTQSSAIFADGRNPSGPDYVSWAASDFVYVGRYNTIRIALRNVNNQTIGLCLYDHNRSIIAGYPLASYYNAALASIIYADIDVSAASYIRISYPSDSWLSANSQPAFRGFHYIAGRLAEYEQRQEDISSNHNHISAIENSLSKNGVEEIQTPTFSAQMIFAKKTGGSNVGALVESTIYKTTDYIDVREFDCVVISLYNGMSKTGIVFYDANKEVLSGLALEDLFQREEPDIFVKKIDTSFCSFIRFSLRSADTFYVCGYYFGLTREEDITKDFIFTNSAFLFAEDGGSGREVGTYSENEAYSAYRTTHGFVDVSKYERLRIVLPNINTKAGIILYDDSFNIVRAIPYNSLIGNIVSGSRAISHILDVSDCEYIRLTELIVTPYPFKCVGLYRAQFAPEVYNKTTDEFDSLVQHKELAKREKVVLNVEDFASVQECLEFRGGIIGDVDIVFNQDTIITSAVLIPSNTRIIINNCRIKMADEVFDNMFRSANVVVEDGVDYPVVQNISQAENISIIGLGNAIIQGPDVTRKDANNHNSPMTTADVYGVRTHMISMCFVAGGEISGIRIQRPTGWGICLEYCSGLEIHDLYVRSTDMDAPYNFHATGDGVDIRTGCHDIVVYNISGSTTDDLIAVNSSVKSDFFPQQGTRTGEYTIYVSSGMRESDPRCGDIHDIFVDNIVKRGDDERASGALVRVNCKGSNQVYNVFITNGVYSGYAINGNYQALLLSSYGSADTTYSADSIHNVVFSNIIIENTTREIERVLFADLKVLDVSANKLLNNSGGIGYVYPYTSGLVVINSTPNS